MPASSPGISRTFDQQRTLLVAHMNDANITQADLARMIGRTPKHVNRVLNGNAGTHELDYWAWVIGVEYVVTLRPREGDA